MEVRGFSKEVPTFSHVGGSFNLIMATTKDVWLIPSLGIWDYVLHVEHVSRIITNCGQHQWVISRCSNHPRAHTVILGRLTIWKNFPPSLATRQAWSYRANRATQTLLFSKSFDIAQVCHENKICSKPALTWKLILVLAFPAHCISN